MKKSTAFLIVAVVVLAALYAIQNIDRTPKEEVEVMDANGDLPNQASVYCEENGGEFAIRLSEADAAVGYCTFPDGSECEAEAFAAGECAPETEIASYALDEISKHSASGDCWFAIEGKVYDVSSFETHPGGEAVWEGCGMDATELYNTRPMGSGTPHSDRAREGLKNFFIGVLAS